VTGRGIDVDFAFGFVVKGSWRVSPLENRWKYGVPMTRTGGLMASAHL
jgi:hypothetical protein